MSEKSNGVFSLHTEILVFLRERRTRNLSYRTLDYYKEKLTRFQKYCENNELKEIHSAEDITQHDIRGFLEELKDEGHNPGGIKTFYSAIKAFMNFYELEFDHQPNYVNPIRRVKTPVVPEVPIQGVTREQVNQLVRQCSNTEIGNRDRALLLVLTETGCRVSEIINLNWDCIDFDDSSILIKQSKSKKPRYVFFGTSCRRALRTLYKSSEFSNGYQKGAVFVTSQGTRLKYAGIRQILRRLCVKAEFEEVVSPHDFRRGFTYHELSQGVDIVSISRILGHSTVSLVARYAKQQKGDLAEKYVSVFDS